MENIDSLIVDLVDFFYKEQSFSDLAYQNAYLTLMDSLACALLAVNTKACANHLGPSFNQANVVNGARVMGTAFSLDPVKATYDNGCLIRWLDYNDTWLAKEWGHPSDNIAACLSCADWQYRQYGKSYTIKEILSIIIKAYEVQGIMALDNAFNQVGLDHVILVKLASTLCSCYLLSLSKQEAYAAVSHVFLDGHPLRVYRHKPNTGPRKSWAAGDAGARGVWLAFQAKIEPMIYGNSVTMPKYGFNDALRKGEQTNYNHPLSCYTMENILFKVSYPAEYHAQTAVECAILLHEQVAHRLDDIETIFIETQKPAIDIIVKSGDLKNPADRDHCLQYMVAVALIKGDLTALDYEDNVAADSRIDVLRQRMTITENQDMTADYYDLEKRSIANSITIQFRDKTVTDTVRVDYPLGHRFRRADAKVALYNKFHDALQQSSLPLLNKDFLEDSWNNFSNILNQPFNELVNKMVI